jgi:cell division protein WhiA
MAMTASVKDELSRVPVSKLTARKSELATMLRFAGALHLIGGHIVIEAELDTGSVARRLRKEIAEIYGHGSEVQIVASGGIRRGSRYLVRVSRDGEGLARQTGLVDLRGRPVKGLPHHVVAGGIGDAEAA